MTFLDWLKVAIIVLCSAWVQMKLLKCGAHYFTMLKKNYEKLSKISIISFCVFVYLR